jgi:hypothetical protein
MAGAIIVTDKYWYFRQLTFGDDDVHDDQYGLAYHRVDLLAENEICLGNVDGIISHNLRDYELPFWDYGMILADLITDPVFFRYAILRSNWQYLDKDKRWSEHE